MRFKTRYKFWHVLVGIICIGIVAAIFNYFNSASLVPKESVVETPIPKKKSSHSAIRPLFMFLYIVTFFYFALNYFYNLIAGNKKWFDYIKVLALMISVSFVYYIFLYYNLPQALMSRYVSLGHMFRVMLQNMTPMFIAAILFAWVTVSREALKQKRILEAQKMQLEMEISQANFNFLKAQINPHFLHNTLNFLYARSLPYSADLSEGILTLSDIMRYALNKGNQRDGKAPLKDEIEHVNNVIKISQLRFNNQIHVDFEVIGNIGNTLIIPFVLITLVENAFMHGDLKNQQYPIRIKLEVKGNELYFYCSNRKKKGTKPPSTGIGLDNIRKRLDLSYGDQYAMIVKDEPEFYTIELTIYQL